jgi:hypothetical protein
MIQSLGETKGDPQRIHQQEAARAYFLARCPNEELTGQSCLLVPHRVVWVSHQSLVRVT